MQQPHESKSIEPALGTLTNSQCEQLLTFLSSQLQRCTLDPLQSSPSVSSFSGICSLYSSSSTNTIPEASWVMDTGATHHVCCTLHLFVTSKPLLNSSITLPNGHSVPIARVGSVRLTDTILLDNVLFVPNFQFNLLSISALTHHQHYSLNFLSILCVI